MPQLPITQSVALWAPTPTAQSAADILAPMPEKYRSGEKPVTQAIASTLAAYTAAHDEAVEYAAAQSDLTRAIGRYLDGKAEDHGFARIPGEKDEDYRTRILKWKPTGTREAVANALNAVLEKYSDSNAVLLDPVLDGWYVEDGTASWSSHVWDNNGGGTPNYPDRLYSQRSNTGILDTIPIPNEADTGRCFGILLPVLRPYVELMWIDSNDGCFVGDGSELVPMAFTSNWYADETEINNSITMAVEATRAHGVRWFLLEDSRL